ncbi:hypothetical protein LXL04_006823 [Taraxacum kok-saghyz]
MIKAASSKETKVAFVFSKPKHLQSADHICKTLQQKRWTKRLQSARRRLFKQIPRFVGHRSTNSTFVAGINNHGRSVCRPQIDELLASALMGGVGAAGRSEEGMDDGCEILKNIFHKMLEDLRSDQSMSAPRRGRANLFRSAVFEKTNSLRGKTSVRGLRGADISNQEDLLAKNKHHLNLQRQLPHC